MKDPIRKFIREQIKSLTEKNNEPSDAEYDQMAKDAEQDDLLRKAAELGYIDLEEAAKDLGYLNEESIEDQAKRYWMKLVKQGKIDKLPSNPTDAFLNQMTKDAIWKDREKEKFEKPQYSELETINRR